MYSCGPMSCEAGSQCAAGRAANAAENPLCALCEKGLYEWGGECVECGDSTVGGRVFGVLLLMIVLVLLLHLLMAERKGRMDGNSQTSPRTGMKIALYFVQSIVLFAGSTITEVLSPFSFDFFGNMKTCWTRITPVEKLMLPFLLPYFALSFVWFLFFLQWSVYKIAKSVEASCRRPSRPKLSHFVLTFASLLLFTYNSITKTTFTFLNCRSVNLGDSEFSMVVDSAGADCSSTEYQQYRILVLLILLLHVVGLPLALALFLLRIWVRGRRKLTLGLHSGYLMDFFQGSYRGQVFFWEAVALARRTILVAVVVFTQQNNALKYGWLGILCVLILVAHMIVKPYFFAAVADSSSSSSLSADASGGGSRWWKVERINPNKVEFCSLVLLALLALLRAGVIDEGSNTDLIVFSVLVWPFVLLLLCWIVFLYWVTGGFSWITSRLSSSPDPPSAIEPRDAAPGKEVEMQPNPLHNSSNGECYLHVLGEGVALYCSADNTLSADVVECQTADGVPYFYNVATKSSSWDRPE